MTPAPKRRNGEDPAAIQAEIERFLSTCKDPALLELGEPAAPLRAGRYALRPRPPGCVLEVWGDSGGLVRRIVSVGRADGRRLPLKARTFGGGELDLEIVDRTGSAKRVERLDGMGRFTKFFSRLLAREFPLHRVGPLTSSPDLQRSLSSSYVRGAQLAGDDSWALIAAPLDAPAHVCDQILTYGLLWLEESRRRRRSRPLAGLRLFLPQGRAGRTLQRLRWIHPGGGARCEVWELGRAGEARLRTAADAPPLALDLPVCRPFSISKGWVLEQTEILASRRGVRWRARTDGLLSLEVGGLSFARASGNTLTYGLQSDTPATPATADRVTALAEHLLRFRTADSENPTHPLYLARPESWLAEQVRLDPAVLASMLLPEPLYSSVPATQGRDRGILDLLGVEADGRLAVIELKASEDIHLPLQALDYWMRVRDLTAAGAFQERGYFTGITLQPAAPRLILAAPALAFHPQTDALVNLLSHEISIERIGLCSDWRRGIRVEFRVSRRGAAGGGTG